MGMPRRYSTSFNVIAVAAVMLAVFLADPPSTGLRSLSPPKHGILTYLAAIAAFYFIVVTLSATARTVGPKMGALYRRLASVVTRSDMTWMRDIHWTWPKIALVAVLVHLTVVFVSWLQPNLLGLLFLAPGILFEELVDEGRTRGGLSFLTVGSSALFFATIVVVFNTRRWIAILVGAAAVLGGLAVGVGNLLRAIGGP